MTVEKKLVVTIVLQRKCITANHTEQRTFIEASCTNKVTLEKKFLRLTPVQELLFNKQKQPFRGVL